MQSTFLALCSSNGKIISQIFYVVSGFSMTSQNPASSHCFLTSLLTRPEYAIIIGQFWTSLANSISSELLLLFDEMSFTTLKRFLDSSAKVSIFLQASYPFMIGMSRSRRMRSIFKLGLFFTYWKISKPLHASIRIQILNCLRLQHAAIIQNWSSLAIRHLYF